MPNPTNAQQELAIANPITSGASSLVSGPMVLDSQATSDEAVNNTEGARMRKVSVKSLVSKSTSGENTSSNKSGDENRVAQVQQSENQKCSNTSVNNRFSKKKTKEEELADTNKYNIKYTKKVLDKLIAPLPAESNMQKIKILLLTIMIAMLKPEIKVEKYDEQMTAFNNNNDLLNLICKNVKLQSLRPCSRVELSNWAATTSFLKKKIDDIMFLTSKIDINNVTENDVTEKNVTEKNVIEKNVTEENVNKNVVTESSEEPIVEMSEEEMLKNVKKNLNGSELKLLFSKYEEIIEEVESETDESEEDDSEEDDSEEDDSEEDDSEEDEIDNLNIENTNEVATKNDDSKTSTNEITNGDGENIVEDSETINKDDDENDDSKVENKDAQTSAVKKNRKKSNKSKKATKNSKPPQTLVEKLREQADPTKRSEDVAKAILSFISMSFNEENLNYKVLRHGIRNIMRLSFGMAMNPNPGPSIEDALYAEMSKYNMSIIDGNNVGKSFMNNKFMQKLKEIMCAKTDAVDTGKKTTENEIVAKKD